MKVVLIYGTAAPAGRLGRAVESFDEALRRQGDVQVAIVDLSRTAMPWADGTPLDRLSVETRNIIAEIASSDAAAIFAPVYRASAPGFLKNLLDLLPVEAMEAKPVAIVSMGSTLHHYLAVDSDLHPILAWFGALPVPGGFYLTPRSFEAGAPTDEARDALTRYATTLLDVVRRMSGVEIRPRPLAAQERG
jgi:FMN reductase